MFSRHRLVAGSIVAALIAAGTLSAVLHPQSGSPVASATSYGPVSAPLPGNVPAGLYGTPTSSTVTAGSVTSLSLQNNGATVTVSAPAGSLPAGTTISVSPVTNTAALAAYLPPGNAYVISFAISWQAPDGSSPVASAPITMTITDPSIKAGDAIYQFTPHGLQLVGTATANGTVTITFTSDPAFVIAQAPRIALTARLGTVKGLQIRYPLSCTAGAVCSGTGQLVVARQRPNNKHAFYYIVLAKASYDVRVGTKEQVVFKITPKGRAILARRLDYRRFRMSLITQVKGGLHAVQPVFVP